MSDVIGRITIPAVSPINIFPLKTEYPHGRAQKRLTITHQFGSASAKIEQRFYVGSPATRYTFHRSRLSNTDRTLLKNFWEAQQGSTLPFFYDAPNEDQTVTRRTVYFEQEPLTFQELSDTVCSVGLTFVEIPDPASIVPLTLNDTVLRFPNSTLTSALLDQAQNMIPLVKIRTLEGSNAPDWVVGTAYPAGFVVNYGSITTPYAAISGNTGHQPDTSPTYWRPFDIFLSDQRVQIGAQLYLPRLLRIGEAGSGVLISQSTDGSSDDAQFSFGNADRVMVKVANDTQLMWARVELSFFHVGTGIKIDLWAGYIVDWASDSGPELTVKCSDILSALTKSSPVSLVSRTCYRRLGKDGCPWNPLVDTRDLVHFPTASTTICDLGYNTPNGCMAHGVATTAQSYGATYCSPQKVLLASKSIGVNNVGGLIAGGLLLGGVGAVAFGVGSITTWYPRTSLISDTIYGNSLPEIWHHDDGLPQYALPVNCKIAAGRDEAEYYLAVGIVGRGPLGAYTIAQMYDSNADGIKDAFAGSTLDGQPNHGFQVNSLGTYKPNADGTFRTFSQAMYGLRQVLGTDPAGATDYFSMGRVSRTGVDWFQQPSDNSWMREVSDGSSAYNQVYAAGVAFCEIRRTKPGNDPLSSPDQHQMIAAVSQGLVGLAWTAPGSRTPLPGCTNPFWVAVNTLLSAVGVQGAIAAIQEAFFDVASAISTAAIADLKPARIIGTGTEIQFRFKGSIDARKPTRDWLQAILNSASGYFVWSFGKLKLGCRENASAVSSFTAGNVLFNSLRLNPVIPKFEKLTVSFADQEYGFQSNTIDLTDQDHAARYNRSQNPLASTFALSGCSTKSQAARLAIARSREELGGVTQAEQDNARLAAWKTTVLALDTEAGMVVRLADPDIPTGTGKFRIQRWALNRDYSIDIQGQTVTDSMYDMTTGPKPADVVAGPVPTEILPSTQVMPWNPGFEAPIVGDSLVISQGFGVQPVYQGAADGTPIAKVGLYGQPPLSVPSVLIGTPQILSTVVHTTGGTIPAGAYVVGITAFDHSAPTPYANNDRSAVSPPVTVVVPAGTSTNRITITVQWPPVSFGGDVFAGVADGMHGLHYEASFGTGVLTNGTIGTYDLLNIVGAGFGAPDTRFDHLEFDVCEEVHGGSWALPVVVVAATTLKFTGQTFTVNDFVGCDLSLLAFADLTKKVGIANLRVVSNTADTFTIGPNAAGVSPPNLTTVFSAGDVFVMRISPTSWDSISFSDSRFVNPVSDFGAGLALHKESGNLAYVWMGAGAGQLRPIADNDHTRVILSAPWDVPIDATSRIVILAPALADQIATPALPMSSYTGGSGFLGTLLSQNQIRATFFIAAYTVDAFGVRCTTPAIREMFLDGAGLVRLVTGNTAQLPTDGTIVCDTSTVAQPTAVTLAAPGMTNVTTACPVSDGANVVNGTIIKVDTAGNIEYMLVSAGGSTAGAVTLTVVRNQLGSSAVAHAAAVAVVLPGALTVLLLAGVNSPIKKLAVSKLGADINYVRIDRGGTDTFPGGATSRLIPTNTTYYCQLPTG